MNEEFPVYSYLRDHGVWMEEDKIYHAMERELKIEDGEVTELPVILKADDVMTWLKADSGREDVFRVLAPYPDSMMDVYKVSPRVSNARFKEPSCVDPLEQK